MLPPSVRVQLTRESLRARDLADYHLNLALVASEHKCLSYEAGHLKEAIGWEHHANDLEARLRDDE